MKKHLQLLLLAALTAFVFSAFAQETTAEDLPGEDEMEFFEFMEGQWQGTAEITNQDRSITKVNQHEFVEFKLDGNVVLVEGIGKDDDGNIVFNAVATIFFDRETKQHRMFAWRDGGMFTEAAIDIVGEKRFTWSFAPNAYANIKYEVRIDEAGRWHEDGYFSPDKENWVPFFTMTLSPVKE